MKPVLFILFFLFLFTGNANAQYYLPIKWEAQPKMHSVPDAFKNQSAVFILDRRHIEYKEEGKETFVYRTIHRIIKILDEKGIEYFNKMSVSAGGDRRIEIIQARTILPDGKIIEVGSDKMKEQKGEDGQKEYVFAMEGVEKNSEVELIYTEKEKYPCLVPRSCNTAYP